MPFLGIAPLVFGVESTGTSRFDSLQATVEKRLSHGVQFLAAYTLSRSVDSAQDSLGSAAFGVYGATVFGEQVFNDQNDVAAQRGPSDFDRRHRFVLSYIWQLPEPAAITDTFSKLSEGWAFSGVVTLQSGLPFSILDSAAGTLFGPGHLFHHRKSGAGEDARGCGSEGSVSSRLNQFSTRTCLFPRPFVPDGALIDGRFPVTGGGTIFGNWEGMFSEGLVSAMSTWRSSSGRGSARKTRPCVFRWEIFNVFNWANFANPASDVSSPSTFGRISAMSVNPRIMQFALKLEF